MRPELIPEWPSASWMADNPVVLLELVDTYHALPDGWTIHRPQRLGRSFDMWFTFTSGR